MSAACQHERPSAACQHERPSWPAIDWVKVQGKYAKKGKVTSHLVSLPFHLSSGMWLCLSPRWDVTLPFHLVTVTNLWLGGMWLCLFLIFYLFFNNDLVVRPVYFLPCWLRGFLEEIKSKKKIHTSRMCDTLFSLRRNITPIHVFFLYF